MGPTDGSSRELLGHELLDAAIAEIDSANSADPNIIELDGRRGPKELLHAQLMTRRVLMLDPDAAPAQLIAARAHHLRRWEHPRSVYPDGRAGYRRWRAAAKRAHAEQVGEILEGLDAPEQLVEQVARIVRKDGLGSDPTVQVHEDALCLVFLETQLDDLIGSLGSERTVEVLGRTLEKMSANGIEAAGGLELSELGRGALVSALDAADRGERP